MFLFVDKVDLSKGRRIVKTGTVIAQKVVVLVVCYVAGLASVCLGEDLTNLGGDLSTDLEGRHAIQASAPNVQGADRIEEQAVGFPLFHRTTGSSDGLGPTFANNSCAGCHVNNGRGPATLGVPSRGGSSVIIKIKGPGLRGDGSAPPVPKFGSQILDQKVGTPIKKTVKLSWTSVEGRYLDGTTYTLRKPKLAFPTALKPPRGATVSLRMSPPLIGMGLLEAVSSSDVVGMSDAQDKDGDGVSGRVNWVKDHAIGGYAVGRFGFKGNLPTVEQQSASALYHDMQITNPIFREEDGEVEATAQDLHSLAVYLKLAGVPKARNQTLPSVAQGRSLFLQIGCNKCHRTTLITGTHPDAELSGQTIHPFTDLLLHDMGKGLADGWSEFSAGGREWRTTPLWGLGFSRGLANGKALYLHDGRARTVEEAILWHGGEATAAQRAFKGLTRVQRQALIDFLHSL